MTMSYSVQEREVLQAGSLSGALRRVFYPATIAVVGMSDTSQFRHLVEPNLSSDVEIFFVNPRYDTVLGRATYASLTAIGRPIDAVISYMSAERTTELVEEAATLDIGGIVTVASGFAEFGEDGARLQERMSQAARSAGIALIGPNGLGFVNVPERIAFLLGAQYPRRSGGISLVSQSGGMLIGLSLAAIAYDSIGLNLLVSAGNEAATDLADYVDFLVDDPDTNAIGLVIEKIRRPEAFFSAVRRAAEAGKPVVALKLARSDRSQQMAASHTGALTGDAWVYDVALRQAGISLAYDPEELIDRLAIVSQVPPPRRTAGKGLAITSMTGGIASLGADIAADEGLELPALEELGDWVRTTIPGVGIANPLDITGQGGPQWAEVISRYGASTDLDALLFINPLADEDKDGSRELLEGFAAAARANPEKTFLAANTSGTPGVWVREAAGDIVAVGRGLRPTLRGLQTLTEFTRYTAGLRKAPDGISEISRPAATPISQPEGLMLPFADAMELLASAGIPVAPYTVVPADVRPEAVVPHFSGPYVVKLADLAHRTEYGAVRLSVAEESLPAAISELRELAKRHGLASTVAVQPMLHSSGEALLGIKGQSELGPLVIFGLGGVLVEALNRVGGRMAPFDQRDALELIEEFRDVKVMHGFRGQPAWDHDALADTLVAAGKLAVAGRDWIDTIDINPLVYGPDGFQAVDALVILSQQGR